MTTETEEQWKMQNGQSKKVLEFSIFISQFSISPCLCSKDRVSPRCEMKLRPTIFFLILIAAVAVSAQVLDRDRTARWREFNKNNFHQVNFAQTRLTKARLARLDRKSTRLNSSHSQISYAVFCLKKKKKK